MYSFNINIVNRNTFICVVLMTLWSHRISAQQNSIVDFHGNLRVQETKIVDQTGSIVQLRGMSLFFTQWEPEFYNYECIRWLRDDWGCTVVRTAMGIEEEGYLTNPYAEKAKVKSIIDACLSLGIYVIVNWHDFHAEYHTTEAIAFFEEIAREYGTHPNIIYEIYSEPETTDWEVVKSYAHAVIPRIRAIDPDNLIIVGTPWWSQYVDEASRDPLSYTNIAYGLHFYAASHKQDLRDRAITALNNGITLFISEFGGGDYTGTIGIDYTELDAWFRIISEHAISWCNWAVEDRGTTASALQQGASTTGGWPLSMLTESGRLFRDKIRSGSPTMERLNTTKSTPTAFRVDPVFPNPFNPSTTIRYSLPEESNVLVEIYNSVGQIIAVPVNRTEQAGNHSMQWNAEQFPSGMYICRVRLGRENYERMLKVILTK